MRSGRRTPSPLTLSPKRGEGNWANLTPLSQVGRGAGGEGILLFSNLTPRLPNCFMLWYTLPT